MRPAFLFCLLVLIAIVLLWLELDDGVYCCVGLTVRRLL